MQGLVGRTKPYSPTFERCRLCYIDVDLVTFVTSSTFQPFILCYTFYYREGLESILPCIQLKDWIDDYRMSVLHINLGDYP